MRSLSPEITSCPGQEVSLPREVTSFSVGEIMLLRVFKFGFRSVNLSREALPRPLHLLSPDVGNRYWLVRTLMQTDYTSQRFNAGRENHYNFPTCPQNSYIGYRKKFYFSCYRSAKFLTPTETINKKLNLLALINNCLVKC